MIPICLDEDPGQPNTGYKPPGCEGRNCDKECESFFEPTHCSYYMSSKYHPTDEKEFSGPEHYTYGQVECWDWYEMAMTPEEFRGAMKNNIWKYTFRAGKKGPSIPDLKKALSYINRWIKYEEGWRHHASRVQEIIDTK